MGLHELGLAINRMRSIFEEYDNRVIKLTLEKQDLEDKLAKAVEACNDLLFHCEDYGVKEESLAILMACEKTRKTLEEREAQE